MFQYESVILPGNRTNRLKTKSYIFLDIDGVLNTYHHRVRQKQFTGKSSIHKWCPISCSNIIQLCRKYDAHIIISSNWKDQYKLEELREHFEANSIPSKYIEDMTPSEVERHSGAEYRGVEIQQWLDENAEDDASYLIIDDDSTILPSQRKHLVQVNPEDGFANPGAVAKAERILSNGCRNSKE